MIDFRDCKRLVFQPSIRTSYVIQSSLISIFTSFNLLLQIEEPTIHLLKSSMEAVAWKHANRIVKPTILRNIQSISVLDLDHNSIYFDRKSIFLGGMTKAKLNYMLKEGDITQQQFDQFHESAHIFLEILWSIFKTSFQLTMKLYAVVSGWM